jgi:hypothetical protein
LLSFFLKLVFGKVHELSDALKLRISFWLWFLCGFVRQEFWDLKYKKNYGCIQKLLPVEKLYFRGRLKNH